MTATPTIGNTNKPEHMPAFRDIDVPAGGSLHDALTELALEIVDRVIPLQSDASRAMHEIRVELWLDSGRIIAFPSKIPFSRRIDVAGCVVNSTDIESAIRAIDESELTDDGYDTALAPI
ncbi:MAG TPA: hypothetical protein QF761_16300 [Pirellulales bacterium]|nr:hypothetical protein [Pirellulales bacterium]